MKKKFHSLNLGEGTRHCLPVKRPWMQKQRKMKTIFFYLHDLKECTRLCRSSSEISIEAKAKAKKKKKK